MRRIAMLAVPCALVLALSATAASAAVVCNDEGDCWRVRDHVEYDPELGLSVHDDDWSWNEDEPYRWREAGPGPGYWSSGAWLDLE